MTRSALQATYNGLLQRGRLLPDPHQASLLSRLIKLQDDLSTSTSAPEGLYIYGSVGTGKSRLADLFSDTLPPAISKRRVHFHQFLLDIHSRLHHARSLPGYGGDPLIQIGREIRSESRVLCFDEFQVTDIADAMILSRLFGSIWREGGIMVATSNRHPENLYENGLNRDVVLPFIREVQSRCEIWEIGGREDYRMRGSGVAAKGDRQETYFILPSAFRRTLEQALDGEKLEQFSISVYGSRNLSLAASEHNKNGNSGKAGKIAGKRFRLVSGTFEQLCEASLGSADYYALCSSTDTIFLSGLRKFAACEKDYVRRFITLIDLAYEMKTRVVCLSNVQLGEVFTNIVPAIGRAKKGLVNGISVKGAGGSSSSMMSTFIGDIEWSATGLMEASLATGGAGETDVGFAVGRAISRLYEMGSDQYGICD